MSYTVHEFVEKLVLELGDFAHDISAIQLMAKEVYGGALNEALVWFIRDEVCRELYRRNSNV